MKILLASPLGYPVNNATRYGGIERLVYEYARILNKEHDVTVLGHLQSIYPPGVKVLPTEPLPNEDIFVSAEYRQYETYKGYLRDFDVIHDFSHQHFASRHHPGLPSLNIFWHAPAIARFPKAPYNIIGLSKWACKEFRRVYKQEARYQQSIVIDTGIYHPGWVPVETVGFEGRQINPAPAPRGERFLTIGIMKPEKGNLRAVEFCCIAEMPLDVVGADTDPAYKYKVKNACDGDKIRFLGEVSHEEKLNLMQTCKALIYANTEPEVTSHKVQEAMLCGAPIIASRLGALPEIITHGKDGWLCSYDSAFVKALGKVDGLKSDYEALKAKYGTESVVQAYMPLYEEVAQGLRW